MGERSRGILFYLAGHLCAYTFTRLPCGRRGSIRRTELIGPLGVKKREIKRKTSRSKKNVKNKNPLYISKVPGNLRRNSVIFRVTLPITVSSAVRLSTRIQILYDYMRYCLWKSIQQLLKLVTLHLIAVMRKSLLTLKSSQCFRQRFLLLRQGRS